MKRDLPLLFWTGYTALLIGLGVYLGFRGIRFNTDFLSIFPKHAEQGGLYEANAEYETRMERTLLAFVSHPDKNASQEAAIELATKLRSNPVFSDVQLQVNTSEHEKWARFLFAERKALLSSAQISALADGSAKKWAEEAVQRLYSPMGTASLTATDPLGLFQQALQASVGKSPLHPDQGYLSVHESGMFSVFLKATLDPSIQDFNSKLVSFYEDVKSTTRDPLQISFFSPSLYSAFGSVKAIEEINLYGTISLIGVTSLLVWSFSSVLPVLTSLVTIALSILSGLVGLQLFFPSTHIMSLLLGISILGIVTDYCTHFFSKAYDPGVTDGEQALKSIRRALALGFMANALTYLCFYFTELEILKQLSVFTLFGIFTTYATVMATFGKIPFRHLRSPTLSKLAVLTALWARPQPRLALPLISLAALFALAMLGVPFDDDVRLLQNSEGALKADENRILSLLKTPRSASYFVVQGTTEDAVLRNEELLKAKLETESIQFMAVSDLIPSQERQQASILAYKKTLPIVDQFFSRIGATTPAPLRRFYDTASQPFRMEDILRASTSIPIQQNWIGRIGDSFYSVVYVVSPHSYDLLKRFNSPNALLFSKAHEISAFLRNLRHTIMKQFSWVVLAISAFLVLVYRGRTALYVLLPPLFASTAALLISALYFAHLNLFHILAVILIFCLGLDYSVFFSESKRASLTAHVGVFISFLSTIGSFGILGLSHTHAVASFGVSVTIGMSICFFVSPFANRGSNA